VKNHGRSPIAGGLLTFLIIFLGSATLTGAAATAAQGLPTAEPCGPATLYVINGVANVRRGPGPEYPIIEQLTAGNVRLITGRHHGFPWWQITTTGGEPGWVWGSTVQVSGYIAGVPLVEAPPLADGRIPDTAEEWRPIQEVECLATYTPTPPEATPTGLVAPLTTTITWGPAGNGWREPLNLSQAGAAVAPQLLVVADGYLLLWQDTVEGFVYARYRQGEWSRPVAAEFPFGTRRDWPDLPAASPTPLFTPLLVAGPGEVIHAWWIDDASEGEERKLFYSSVAAGAFGDLPAWSARQQVATGVMQMAAAVDEAGQLHLAYLQTTSAAGVYYSRLSADGASWSEPLLLHSSTYFRQLDETNANVQVAAGGNTIYVAWDDWPRGRVMLARSADGGLNWLEAEEVDSRSAGDSGSVADPQMVRLVAGDDNLYLTWQAGYGTGSCAEYYRWSAGGGQSWQGDGVVVDECLPNVALTNSDNGPLLLGLGPAAAHLYLWHDGRWIEPADTLPLAGLVNEETFRPVTFDCGLAAAVAGDQLVVAACGRDVGQDVWLSGGDLTSLRQGLAVTPVWNAPVVVNEVAAGEETAGSVLSPVLVPGHDGRRHAFWSQATPGEDGLPAGTGREIYYAVWDGGHWSRPVLVVAVAEQKAAQPAAVVTANGRLLLLWSGGASGEIYFSWADEARATAAIEWAAPALLPAPLLAGSAPDVVVDGRSGVVYATYAIPFNEGRGVYLVTSEDGGEHWSEARLVFDGVAAGWERVERPRLALSGPNQLHLLFEQRSLPDNLLASTLYYTHSSDGGATWDEPRAVENGTPQSGPAVWGDLVAGSDRILHRAWQEQDSDGRNSHLWHQMSADNGATWGRAVHVGGFAGQSGPAALVTDGVGQFYLLAFAADGQQVTLAQWQWLQELERWEVMESLALEEVFAGIQPAELAATIAPVTAEDDTPTGELVALFSGGEGETDTPWLLSTGRLLALATLPATPLPTPTLTPPPAATVTATPLPLPAATPSFPKEDSGREFSLDFLPVPGGNLTLLGALLAIVPAVLIVILVVAVYARFRPGRM
jgi:hypothetical protein